MGTRVGAFEIPMSQLSQELLFVFIGPLDNFYTTLECEEIHFFGGAYKNDVISKFLTSKSQKHPKLFSLKIVANLFSNVFVLPIKKAFCPRKVIRENTKTCENNLTAILSEKN